MSSEATDADEPVIEQLRNSKVKIEDGDPVLELPSGDRVRLNISVTEWTHEEPQWGESVDMAAEVDTDDFAWWTLYPNRSDVSTVTTEEDFPKVTIVPRIEEDSN